MGLDEAGKERLVRAIAGTAIAHAEELTALDQAIGDGDHGLNLKRGFEAVLAELPALAQKPLPDMLKAIGMAMVMKVGGASGPLVGTFFLELSKALPDAPSRDALVAATGRAIDAVKARGKSEPGQKTLLDVLVPVQAAFAGGADGAALKKAAAEAAEATVPMLAIRGRASFLGERSIGHMDPGARSSSLMIAAAIDALGA
jgi:phosphoenolpyruvate---glycerone phosphotransferase subunit DhaL